MLTYNLTDRDGNSLYEHLYGLIREDILAGNLKPGDKLPSKRKMAANHSISVITVENAYEQLALEGYIEPVEKKGYFVASFDRDIKTVGTVNKPVGQSEDSNVKKETEAFIDFTKNTASNNLFPSATWAKLVRRRLLDDNITLLNATERTGVYELRKAIGNHLAGYRGLKVNPDNIIIGAGTEYLYGLLVQLLGRNGMIAVEDPGHIKVSQVYESNGVRVLHIPIDRDGLSVKKLHGNKVLAVHISPSHHFPTGVVMPVTRRYELLNWAKENRSFIIEDDYDSEFRFSGKPIPTMASIDCDSVIYMNTFSKTLTSAIRIAYMVLPDRLMKIYRDKLGFYSCTVSSIEQYTLADFIKGEYFERHLSRMRNYYRGYRASILEAIRNSALADRIEIQEENAGLHFLISFNSEKTDDEIISIFRYNGIIISCVGDYCYNDYSIFNHKLIVNYSDINAERITQALEIMGRYI